MRMRLKHLFPRRDDLQLLLLSGLTLIDGVTAATLGTSGLDDYSDAVVWGVVALSGPGAIAIAATLPGGRMARLAAVQRVGLAVLAGAMSLVAVYPVTSLLMLPELRRPFAAWAVLGVALLVAGLNFGPSAPPPTNAVAQARWWGRFFLLPVVPVVAMTVISLMMLADEGRALAPVLAPRFYGLMALAVAVATAQTLVGAMVGREIVRYIGLRALRQAGAVSLATLFLIIWSPGPFDPSRLTPLPLPLLAFAATLILIGLTSAVRRAMATVRPSYAPRFAPTTESTTSPEGVSDVR